MGLTSGPDIRGGQEGRREGGKIVSAARREDGEMKSQKAKKNVGEEKGSRAESWGLADYHFLLSIVKPKGIYRMYARRDFILRGWPAVAQQAHSMSCTFCAARCGEYPDRPSCSAVGLSQM
jgi:hypothetical protein